MFDFSTALVFNLPSLLKRLCQPQDFPISINLPLLSFPCLITCSKPITLPNISRFCWKGFISILTLFMPDLLSLFSLSFYYFCFRFWQATIFGCCTDIMKSVTTFIIIKHSFGFPNKGSAISSTILYSPTKYHPVIMASCAALQRGDILEGPQQ